ncbi:MAG: J domain-containing protein [Microthrixaceae bacterium]
MTLYEVIGARTGDDAPAMRRAYLAEVRLAHPDVGPPDERQAREARMRELNAAWAVLSDDRRRRDYDASLADARHGTFAAGRSGAATATPPERPFRPLHPDNDDTGWREESDTPVPGTRVHPALQLLPMALGALGLCTFVSSFMFHNDRLVGLAVVFGFLAGIAFLLVPLVAMLAGARAERR